MATTVYLTKEQRISITNFLKWLMVDFNVDLKEAIFEDYISGIGSTMHEGINNYYCPLNHKAVSPTF